jgi:hypothetical protein
MGPWNIDCAFIGYTYNNSAYWFLVQKSTIEDIHLNTIMESKNATFLEDVFPWNEAWKNYSLKKINKVSSSNHHQSKDDEIDRVRGQK